MARDIGYTLGEVGFNSCMVQLKYKLPEWKQIDEISFNSCMVQLKWDRRSEKTFRDEVLIPVWCNWNRNQNHHHFPFQKVLIPVWCNWNYSPIFERTVESASFNSCMVQLKYPLSSFFEPVYLVLIPVWCNWNFPALLNNAWGVMF